MLRVTAPVLVLPMLAAGNIVVPPARPEKLNPPVGDVQGEVIDALLFQLPQLPA